MKFKVGFKKAFLLVTFLVFLSGCGQAGGENGKEKASVAALNNYPPLIFKESGQLTGFEYEILEAIAEEEKLDLEYKEMKFDGFIPGLQSNQVDIASSLVIREERKEVVDFSDVFLKSGLVVVVTEDSPIQTLDDLEGKTIVATQGSTTYEKAQELAEEYGGKTKPLKETDALYLELESGNSDALVLNSPTVDYRIQTDGDNVKFRIVGDYLTEDEHAFAVKKGNEELLEKINSGLSSLQENGKYDEIHAKWFGDN